VSPQHFGTQINRLAETYGAGPFKRERADLIWRAVKDMPDEWMTRTVDGFIATFRQAPLVPDFAEASRVERQRLWESRKRQSNVTQFNPQARARCTLCRDTGCLLAFSKESTTGPYAFLCRCDAGTRDVRNLPRWGADYDTQYEVIA